MARLLDITPFTYGRWEKGQKFPPLNKAIEIADIFQEQLGYTVLVDELLLRDVAEKGDGSIYDLYKDMEILLMRYRRFMLRAIKDEKEKQ